MSSNSAKKDRSNLLLVLQGALLELGDRHQILRQNGENGYVISTGMRFHDREPVTLVVEGTGVNLCVVSDDKLTKSRIGKSNIPAQALAIRNDMLSRYRDVHEANDALYVPSSFKLLSPAISMLTGAVLTIDTASIVASHILPEYATISGAS